MAVLWTLVIPWAAPGSAITIANDQSDAIQIELAAGSTWNDFTVPAYGSLEVPARISGAVTITSSAPFQAWSVVEGATFSGQALNTNVRSFVLAGDSAFAIANPSSEETRLTLWLHAGNEIYYRNVTLAPGETRAGWRDEWLFDSWGDGVVIVASERPVAVGVVRYRNGRCETVPVRSVTFETAPNQPAKEY
jgi:hypothetical protein